MGGQHFSDPRNVGEIPYADGIGNACNPVDGDNINPVTTIKHHTNFSAENAPEIIKELLGCDFECVNAPICDSPADAQ